MKIILTILLLTFSFLVFSTEKELQEKTNPLMTKLYGQNSQTGMSGEEMPQTNSEKEVDNVD